MSPRVLVTLVGAALLSTGLLPAAAVPGCAIDDLDDRCELWAHAHSGPTQGNSYLDEHARDVAFAPSGDAVYVTGTKWWPGSGTDAVTVAYDATTGAVRWTAREEEGSATAEAVAATPGTVLMAGSVDTGPPGAELLVAAYDAATGARRWRTVHRTPGAGAHVAYSIAVAGGIAVVAGEAAGPAGKEFATLGLDLATGEILWSAREAGAPGSVLGASTVVADPVAGRAFVIGALHGAGGPADMDFVTAAYDLTGDAPPGRRLWMASYDGGARGLDVAFDVALSPDRGTVFVTGPSQRPGGTLNDPEAALIAYDAADGSVRWVRRHGMDGGSSTGMRVSVSADGERLFVVGVQSGTGPTAEAGVGSDLDFRAVAYDAGDGSMLWSTVFTGPAYSFEYPFDAELGPEALYVTGLSSANGHGTDFATIALDPATGDREWVARYNSSPAGIDGDVPRALAVSPDGERLAVTGQFTYLGPIGGLVPAQENDRDFGTVVYDL